MNHHLGALYFRTLLRFGRPTVRAAHHVWCTITMNHLNAKRNIGVLLRQPYLMIVFSTSNSPWLVLLALLQTLHLPYTMYTAEGVQ